MSDLFRFAQLDPFSLAGAGAIIGDTSITLKSMTDIDGNTLSMSGTFGDIGFGTLDPGNGILEEQICFTGLTNNANGTVTLMGISNVDFVYPYTQTSGLAKTHAGSTPFVISNTSGFYDKLTSKSDDETITGTWTFEAVPNSTQPPVAGNDLANKAYVLSVVNGGPVSTDSVIIAGVAGETLVAGNLVYLKTADGLWYKTTANTSTTVNDVKLGTAQGAGTIGVAITGGVLISGVDSNNTGLSVGATYYAGNTAGSISSSAGTISRVIGKANSIGKLVFDPYFADIPTDAQKSYLNSVTTSSVGIISPYGGRTAPSGFLLCDGTAVSRSTYSSLFSVIAPAQTFTVTIASPAVFSATAHGLVAGDQISLSTTGALPTGLVANVNYYIISTGLSANAFRVALSPGGAAVNTSGSQSGVQTLYASAWGKGDGSTTFNVPDLRSRTPIGLGQSNISLAFEPAAVDTTNDWVTVINNTFPSQGQVVQLTTTGTLPAGLSLATNYYILRITGTTVGFATNLGNANGDPGGKVNITDQGSGVHTMTFTTLNQTVLGQGGGEETHLLSIPESPAHTHNVLGTGSTSGNTGVTLQGNGTATTQPTSSTGENLVHNNLQPFALLNYIIKT